MSPIPLGILASSGGAGNPFELIASQTLSSDALSITFSSIPTNGTYKHLTFRIGTVSDNALLYARFNGITDATYNYQFGGEAVFGGSNQTSADVGTSSWAVSDTFYRRSFYLLELPYYTDTNSRRSLVGRGYGFQGGGGQSRADILGAGNTTTSAIESVNFRPNSGAFKAGTIIELYGWKGA